MSNTFENGVVSAFSKVTDTLLLAFLWVLCSIPVVTAGAASGALYYGYHKAVRQDGGHCCRYFFKAFKSNFKQATGIWLMYMVFVLLSLFACFMLRLMRQSVPAAGFALAMGAMILGFAVVWGIYVFAYQARFENTTVNVMKNCVLLAIANAPRSLLLLIVFAAAVILSVYKPVLIVPAVAVYIWIVNRLLERVFRGLMTKEALIAEMEADGT